MFIKPTNILLNTDGEIKLVDMGITAIVENTEDRFRKTFCGTAQYMSPERILGKPYTYASDIWSFGIILHLMACGSSPNLYAKSYFDMISLILNNETFKLDTNKFSPELCDLVNKCVDHNPDARHTCDQLLEHPFFNTNTELIVNWSPKTNVDDADLEKIVQFFLNNNYLDNNNFFNKICEQLGIKSDVFFKKVSEHRTNIKNNGFNDNDVQLFDF